MSTTGPGRVQLQKSLEFNINMMHFWSVALTLGFPLTLAVPLPPPIDNCIRSVAQIHCSIPPELIWSCVKPNVVLIKGSIHELDKNEESVPGLNQQLLINCTAPFPIDIRVSGFQLHDVERALFVRNAENVFNEATFVYSVGLRYQDRPLSRVRTISVFKLREESAAVTFSVFHLEKGDSGNGVGIGHEHVMERGRGVMVIPCISPDPNKPPELVHVKANQSATVVDFDYDITQGFIMKTHNDRMTNSTEEIFDCFLGEKKNLSSSNHSINANIRFKVVSRKELQVYPEFEKVILFQQNELKLICRSTKKVQLIGMFRGESVKAKTTLEFGEFTSTLEQKLVQVGDNGNVTCVDEETKDVLFLWIIETLDIEHNEVLKLTKMSENLVSCVSSQNDGAAQLQTIFCQGKTNCEATKWCLTPGMKCPKAVMGTTCEGGRGSCLFMNTSDAIHSQGMIHCRAGNYSYTSTFFRGFNGVLYLDWENAPLNALIEVFVPPKNVTMYPHNSYPFGCRAAPFISDGKIQWVIRGKDGSEILLHKKRVDNISPVYNLDSNIYTVRESNIRLIYPNDYDVLCLVPWYNATGSLRYHKRINVAAHVAPVKEILIASACIIILLIIPLVVVILRLKKAREAIRNLTEQEVEQFIKGDPYALNSKDKDAHEKITATPYNQDFEIPRHKLLIDNENKLGEGAFGLVLKGKVEGVSEVVAVKTVKPRCEVEQFKGFMSELKIMMYIGRHPFVVGLIGAHTDKIKEKIMYIVVEYCSNGSLDKLLLASKNRFVNQVDGNRINTSIENIEAALYNNVPNSIDTTERSQPNENYVNDKLRTIDLLKWAYQIASGMDYLAMKKVVHADLAARNVLIHDNGTAKITDFGLSRQLMNYTQYVKKHQEPLPWRWMAEESLRSLAFSSQSDVWAYGVTLWEMFSLGDIPYPGLAWTVSFVDDLTTGLRMTKPCFAPPFIYDMMLNCWHHTPQSRPSFGDLTSQFSNILESLDISVEKVIIPTAQPDNRARIMDIFTNKRNTIANVYENQN